MIDSDRTGTILADRYRVLRRIGSGGMGTVYAVERIADGAPLVTKVLQREFLSNALMLDRFLEEGNAGVRLQHPNIVRIFSSEVASDGAPFIVMELLRGKPLSARLEGGAKVSLQETLTILRPILSNLSFAHRNGVVHRDLKPDNIFLAEESGLVVPKLLDFGVAKLIDAAGGTGSKTQTGSLLGTPMYMSPEQILHPRNVDARTDLFSIGVLAYELITGKLPFAGSGFSIMMTILSEPPAPIETVAPEYAHLSAFFARALEKDPTKRFQTADEMSDALEQVATGVRPTEGVRAQTLALVMSSPVPTAGSPGTQRPSSSPRATATLPNRPGTAHLPSQPPSQYPPASQAYPNAPRAGYGAIPLTTQASAPANPALNTLASGGPAGPRSVQSPAVTVVEPEGPRGIAPMVVVLMVVGALVAGFLLGFGIGHS